MKKSIQALAVALAAAIALTGCMSFPGTIQDKSKPMDQNGYTVVGPEVQAKKMSVSLFGISVTDMTGSPSRKLYKECLQTAGNGADALIEYSADTMMILLGPFTLTINTLTGVPVKTK